MHIEDYITIKMSDVLMFKNKVKEEGKDIIKNVLSDEWFQKILEDGERVWKNELNEMYSGYYFPFRWLCEEDEWHFINTNFGNLYDELKKKDVIRNKLKNIATSDLDTNRCTAFELEVICRFYHDKILSDIDHKVNNSINRNVDALIEIDNREIFVEITSYAISKNIFNRVGMIPVYKNNQRVNLKINSKYDRQLKFVNGPTILITTLIPSQMHDQFQAKIQVAEYFKKEESKTISAIIVSDTYLFKYGACFFNSQSIFPLNDNEKEYLLKCIITNDIY